MMSKLPLFLCISMFVIIMIASCEKNEESGAVNIESVWTNTVDTVPHTITEANVGNWIRLQGSGFTGLKAVLCNGKSVYINPNYVTDNNITFYIDTAVAVPGDSTIKVVTSHGEATYHPFSFIDTTNVVQ